MAVNFKKKKKNYITCVTKKKSNTNMYKTKKIIIYI